MDKYELSAKVAVLRGENVLMKCTSPWAGGCHSYVPIAEINGRWTHPDAEPELCADAYRWVKPYADDMNAAFELIREIQAAGLIVNVEFQAESQEPYDDRWTMVQVWTVERVKVDGIMQPQQNELLVECWECSWFNPCVAICKAYIEWREQHNG